MEHEKLINDETDDRIRVSRSNCSFIIALIIAVVIVCTILPFVVKGDTKNFTIVSVFYITNTSYLVHITANKNETANLVMVYIYGNDSIGIVGDDYFNYYPNMTTNFTHCLKDLRPKTLYLIYLSKNFHVTSNKYYFHTN